MGEKVHENVFVFLALVIVSQLNEMKFAFENEANIYKV